MKILAYPMAMSVCALKKGASAPAGEWVFTASTPEEYSVVCPTPQVPADALRRADGWCLLAVDGVLDFSLVGILSRLTELLAQAEVSVFALSTYNTDYLLVRAEAQVRALSVLSDNGYVISHVEDFSPA